MEIIAIDKNTNLPNIVKTLPNNILTTNYLKSLVGVGSATPYTNNYWLYFGSTQLFSHLVNIGKTGVTCSFMDMTQATTVNNAYKIKYNSSTGKFFITTKTTGFSRLTVAPPTTAAKANLNTHNEQYIFNCLSTTPSFTSSFNGITYASNIFTITSTLPRLYYIKVVLNLPFDTLTANSQIIMRIRETNITGTILAQTSFINTATSNSSINITASYIGLNASSAYCFTLQLLSGTYAITNTRAGIATVSIREIG